ncbi:MAG: UbiD family decarboxylase [Chloroflexota bacterium]
MRDKLSEPLELVPPIEVKDGPLMENVHTGDEVDLFEFPTPKWLPGDGGRYIGTGDTVITRDPDEGWVNVGCYRVQIQDKRTATIHFTTGKHGDMIRRKYWAKGQSCPAVVTCGGDPLLVEIAGTRIPWGVSEYDWVGWWRKKPLEVIKGPLTGLPIPASTEIALEGEMVPYEVDSRIEGPFAEWTGHYSPAKPEASFRVKSILHRDNPIILGYLAYLGYGLLPRTQNMLRAAGVWSTLDKTVPGVKGVWLSLDIGERALVVSIEQKYSGHAKQVAVAALGHHSFDLKYIIVVDEDIDPSDTRAVLFALALRANPEEFDIIRNSWCSSLDPLLSPQKKEMKDITTSVALITACKPFHWIKDFPPLIKIPPELQARVNDKWGRLLE